jgi:hypothetical protein
MSMVSVIFVRRVGTSAVVVAQSSSQQLLSTSTSSLSTNYQILKTEKNNSGIFSNHSQKVNSPSLVLLGPQSSLGSQGLAAKQSLDLSLFGPRFRSGLGRSGSDQDVVHCSSNTKSTSEVKL